MRSSVQNELKSHRSIWSVSILSQFQIRLIDMEAVLLMVNFNAMVD